MQNKLKPLLSYISIGLFLLIALATHTSLLYESTNTTVAISDCEMKPQVTGRLHVDVYCYEPDSLKPVERCGEIFLVHQKVKADTCHFDLFTNTSFSFCTAANGHYVYVGDNEWMHDNSEDLWRIEVYFQHHGLLPYVGERKVLVSKYSSSNFKFTIKSIKKEP